MPATEKSVAIVQSSYIPWKGYFDLVASVDEFILLDDVQYTRRDWRNRNRIKTPSGMQWLTIPVRRDHGRNTRIDEIEVADPGWAARHWRSMTHSYSRAAHFGDYREWVEELYSQAPDTSLSRINRWFITAICEILEIDTPIRASTEYAVPGAKTTRLVNLCRAAGATRYLSGPAARAYLDEASFREAGIALAWMSYDYPEYPQLYPPFEHAVTVLDLIFHVGPDARAYMRSSSAGEAGPSASPRAPESGSTTCCGSSSRDEGQRLGWRDQACKS